MSFTFTRQQKHFLNLVLPWDIPMLSGGTGWQVFNGLVLADHIATANQVALWLPSVVLLAITFPFNQKLNLAAPLQTTT